VLVGHSYGGTLITKAGTHERVGALVFISALAPDEDETSTALQAKFAQTPVFQKIEVADGRIWLGPGAIADFAGDLPEAEQNLVLATAPPPAAELFDQQVPGVAWKTKPSWYIVANHDRSVNPDLERFVADRMGAKTRDIDSGHVPMLSHPEFVLDVIRDAAKSLEA
jgi:pimeloyl-ACP methyl ester carboxylesterase